MAASRTHVARLACAALTLASSALHAQEVTLEVSHFLASDLLRIMLLLVPGISLWLVHLNA